MIFQFVVCIAVVYLIIAEFDSTIGDFVKAEGKILKGDTEKRNRKIKHSFMFQSSNHSLCKISTSSLLKYVFVCNPEFPIGGKKSRMKERTSKWTYSYTTLISNFNMAVLSFFGVPSHLFLLFTMMVCLFSISWNG